MLRELFVLMTRILGVGSAFGYRDNKLLRGRLGTKAELVVVIDMAIPLSLSELEARVYSNAATWQLSSSIVSGAQP